MPRPAREALALGEAHRLAIPYEPRRGLAGEALGRGTGSSLEFQDRRSYQAGDDVRHLDWRAFARTDQLLVRQYREEVLPRLEILFDDSSSMGVDPGKGQRAVDVVGVLVGAARASGFEVRLIGLGDRTDRVELERFEREGFALDGRRPLEEAVRDAAPRLAPGALRILLSDFLSPHRADVLVRSAARDAGTLALLQCLSPDDREPAIDKARRLVDAETGETVEIVIDAAVRERYQRRLGALGEALASECLRVGGRFQSMSSGAELRTSVRDDLVSNGFLTS